jgi:hypothetical protein
MTKLIIEYSDDIDEVKVDERFEIIQQIGKLSKSPSYKLYTQNKTIYVSVIMCDGIAIQNRTQLRISEDDDIIQVAKDFSEDVRIESKLKNVTYKIYIS